MHALATALSTLTIAVSPGSGGAVKHWTLTCGPAGGTLPRATLACAKLEQLSAPFAPTPKRTACSQIYGGPQTARVTGTFRGHRVTASFARRNGCEVARWQRVSFLLVGAFS